MSDRKRPREESSNDRDEHERCSFPCKFPSCNESFTSQWSLTRHTRVHEGNYPHKCDKCSQVFVQKCSLDRHYATHSAERPFKCTFCDQTFKLKEYLKEHKNKQHAKIIDDIRAHMAEHPTVLSNAAEEQIRGSIADVAAQRDEARELAQHFAKQLLRCCIRITPEHLAMLNEY